MKRPVQPPPIRLGQPPASHAADELAALREATREAHEVLRDLRTERRAVEQLVATIEDRVKRAVSDRMEEALKRDLAALSLATDKAMRDSVARVTREFDRLARIFTGRERGGEPLEDLVRRHVAAKETSPT